MNKKIPGYDVVFVCCKINFHTVDTSAQDFNFSGETGVHAAKSVQCIFEYLLLLKIYNLKRESDPADAVIISFDVPPFPSNDIINDMIV